MEREHFPFFFAATLFLFAAVLFTSHPFTGDDDDWLNKKTLKKTNLKIIELGSPNWLVENRFDVLKNKPITRTKLTKKINYLWDYLITKQFKGDATHFIKSKNKNKKFLVDEEEWFFFLQVGKCFYYYNNNATLSNGYDNAGMSQNLKYKKRTKIKNTSIIIQKAFELKLVSFNFLLYFFLRFFAVILK
jgi:hypothetical protein